MLTPLIGSRDVANLGHSRRATAPGMTIVLLLCHALQSWPVSAEERHPIAPSAKSALDTVERKLVKEPKYNSPPKYGLIALGANAKAKVWMVEDGKTLYIDKNGNGDLTDDGPPVDPTNVRDLGKGHWDFDYVLDAITPADGSRHTEFCLRRWNYGQKEDSYGLSLGVYGQMPMYAGWFGTFWAASPQTVPIIHFGDPLEPRIMRRKEFVMGERSARLSVGFMNNGLGEGATSRLSIDALPKTLVPKLQIDWPVAAGSPPLRTSHLLKERCCYWEFYELHFETPENAVAGDAKITVSFEGGDCPFQLSTNQVIVPVLAGGLAADTN